MDVCWREEEGMGMEWGGVQGQFTYMDSLKGLSELP